MRALLHDLRLSARSIARNPGFATTVVLTLALGNAATTTIFSFVDAVLLSPLRYPEDTRLVAVLPGHPARMDLTAVTPGDFVDWQAGSRVFDSLTAFQFTGLNLLDGGEPIGLLAAQVTERFTDTVGVAPQLGHSFAEESAASRPTTVVISDRLWRQRFRSDPSIVGRALTFDGARLTVIGVMPAGFSFPRELARSSGARVMPDIDLWVPLAPQPGYRRNALLQVVGRLKQGVNVEQATMQMRTLADAIRARVGSPLGPPNASWTPLQLVPIHDRLVAPIRPLLLVVFGAVALLQLIACANVANLLLARSSTRRRDVAIRAALGSGRGRLIRQHLTDSIMLALIGGMVGTIAAAIGLDVVASLIPPGALPHVTDLRIDGRVLAFSLLSSLMSGVLFGIWPALRAARSDAVLDLKDGSIAQTRRTGGLRALVIGEVALAFVLLTAAGLVTISFARLTGVDPGFRSGDVLVAEVALPEGRYPDFESMRRFAGAVLNDLSAVPRVTRAAAVNWLPIGGAWLAGDFSVEGATHPPGFDAVKSAVSQGYFETMSIPMLAGRDFTAEDSDGAPLVVVVTEQLARRVWPGQSAVGKRLRVGFGRAEDDPWRVVVGVVQDVKQMALDADPSPAIYFPINQAPVPFLLRGLTVVVRSSASAEALAPAVRDRIHRIDPLLSIGRVTTMGELVSQSVAEPRFRAVLLGGFAGSALLLIGVGMLGVLGYAVASRTREIGIRMAIGARSLDVVRLVLGQALTMATIGVAGGVGLALITTRLLARFLFQIEPRDPATFAGAAAVIGALALVASYLPARRAARIDPLLTLRAE